ncbi:ankyrin repeat domain-containing protein 65 isoform X2 [Selaginella moellendorffii]|uniref:ankyrin repeat domain-containing protein 65 isoform X2 n=1 Tax=Selaginella moellendorffii TaxID=88036 RepID=UPI000D1C7002|nr:ankyrin repeat domain-containing protein 65 isoform X2 [Selaginella moellendorffii]|eukprot:XP_024525341.1 ankyrin repeat domain-containing protein 65 isoform X2 [Selaginella moellendorffii]
MALAAASRAGDLDNLCVLLKAGADPNARDKRGKTALHEACSQGHDKCVEALLRAGALVSAHKTNGFTPLHYAAATGRASIISILLASFGFSGANACDRDHKGEQAIHLAARGGFVPAVEILLAHGASGNAASNNGRTRYFQVKASSVHTASLHGHELVLRLLLSSGADPAACDTGGSQPIHDAAAGGHVGCMELLTHLGADPNASDCAGCTPLHRGSSAGEVDAARWLLKKGVDANCRDNIGSTPLYWAASRGRADVVALLIREGNADPSAPNAHRSPLHVAAGWRHLSVCDELLKAGADPLAVDREGLTVLQVAKTDDVAKLLDEELVASRS